MNQQDQGLQEERIWYKKKRYIISLGILVLIIVFGLSDSDSAQSKTLKQAPIQLKKVSEPKCNSNYSGCLLPNASDYDCAGGSGNGPNYTGQVRVLGYDEYGLDRDGDGWGCE